jgi:hypothetical protein
MNQRAVLAVALLLALVSSLPAAELSLPGRPEAAPTGSEFLKRCQGLEGIPREQLVLTELLDGNLPRFLGRLQPVELSADGVHVTVFVTPDYLAIGSDRDFVYAPLDYDTATAVADRLGCVLPTPRIVDAIYAQAAHHLDPRPLPASPQMRSTAYLARHQGLLDAQRAGMAEGELIAGHKKDVVLSNRLHVMPGRIAIYGWHRAPAAPIQPLSLVHGVHYVDYSHGVRLVSDTVLVDGAPRSIYEALQDPRVAPALSDEGVTRDPWKLMHPRTLLASGAGRALATP